MAVDDERGVRLVPAQHLVDGLAYGSHLRRVEIALGEHRRVAGCEQQMIPVSQGYVEPLGKMEHHLGARAGASGLDEAQMPRRDSGLERELELAEPAALPPLSQHRADRRTTRNNAHWGRS